MLAGSYTVEVDLNDLRELNLIATDGNASRRIEIRSDHPDHKHPAVSAPIDITIGASGSLVFIPEGKPGSSAAITIIKN